MPEESDWIEPEPEAVDDIGVIEYEVTSTPNDFNVLTLFNFIDTGVVVIPPFQRNFVWDQRRASKLIESLVIGLPIPQVFLYERRKNEFLVIDGQQRLLSLYYFMKLRFPRLAKRTEIRRRLIEGAMRQPDSLLAENDLFQKFDLRLPTEDQPRRNPLDGLDYESLGDLRGQLDLRTLRVVIVKQVSPEGSDSIFEIFNRLNTGGVNLMPQEIRMSLYQSDFMNMLARVNFDPRWRALVGREDADLRLRDVEFLLRGLALTEDHAGYQPSMVKFLNRYSAKGQAFTDDETAYRRDLLGAFFDACTGLGEEAFHNQAGRFTVSFFDGVFAAACSVAFQQQSLDIPPIEGSRIRALRNDPEYTRAALEGTTSTSNVQTRIRRAGEILFDSE